MGTDDRTGGNAIGGEGTKQSARRRKAASCEVIHPHNPQSLKTFSKAVVLRASQTPPHHCTPHKPLKDLLLLPQLHCQQNRIAVLSCHRRAATSSPRTHIHSHKKKKRKKKGRQNAPQTSRLNIAGPWAIDVYEARPHRRKEKEEKTLVHDHRMWTQLIQ